jgi:hypothetical protein
LAFAGAITVTLPSSIAYSIATRIELPHGYPRLEPRAYEVDGRFPHTADRHFYPDGRACLWLADFETKWRPDDPDALGTFLDEVLAFYLRQLILEVDPSAGFPGPWRGHGVVGVIEHLEEALGVRSDRLPAMWRALAGGVHRNAPCPCGTRIRYRNCHRRQVGSYRSGVDATSLEEVVTALRRLRSLRVPSALRGHRPARVSHPRRP